MSNSPEKPRFLFPDASLASNSSEKHQEKPVNPAKSELELKRELLRKKKEELEKKIEKKQENEGFFEKIRLFTVFRGESWRFSHK